MLLKDTAEDFIVEEVPTLPRQLDSGSHLIVKLVKTRRNTIDVVRELSRHLHVPEKNIGYAGLKDKIAVTTQYLSIRAKTWEDLRDVAINDCAFSFVSYASTALSLGDLEGNKFTVTVRNRVEDLKTISSCPNYFGEQRFSQDNVQIGRLLVKQDFVAAVQLLIKRETSAALRQVAERYEKIPTDPIGAIRLLPKKLLSLYLAAYQSYIWNESAAAYLAQFPHRRMDESFGSLVFPTVAVKNVPWPIVGFATKLDAESTVHDVLHREGINARSFVIRTFPEISFAGEHRDLMIPLTDLRIERLADDVQKVSFFLPKGSYATIALRAMG